MALPVTIRSQPTQAVQAWYLEVCIKLYCIQKCSIWLQKSGVVPHNKATVLARHFRRRGNVRELVENTVSRRKLSRLLVFAAPKDAAPPNFAEKTSANSHKTAKIAKVISLESFRIGPIPVPSYSGCCSYRLSLNTVYN